MLSLERWHEQIPRGREANLEARLRLLDAVKRGREPARRAIIRACKDDILFYINFFVWGYNPAHVGGEVGPFITWDFQDRALRETVDRMFHFRKDCLWEKSRELGATWLALMLWDWCCLFHSRKKFLCISHSLDAVDRPEDPDSLFWKVQFMHQHLPDWLLRGVTKRKLGFSYPATESSLNGTAPTKRSGVGGRATAVMLDEFSKQEDDWQIYGQTRDTGPRLFIGTHYGLDKCFYALTQKSHVYKVQMHWSQHPEKRPGLYRVIDGKLEVIDRVYPFPDDYSFVLDGSPTGGPFPGVRSVWYDVECVERENKRDVAMHLDIDPQGSLHQVFDPLVIRALQGAYACAPYWQGDVVIDPRSGKAELQQATSGPLSLWVHQTGPGTFPAGPYVAGGDLSTGTGATPSCISIVNASTGEKVGEYVTANIDPAGLAPIVVALLRMFRGESGVPWFAWEQQGPGAIFSKVVLEQGYENVYYMTKQAFEDRKISVSDRPGWYPSPHGKRVVIEDYNRALRARAFVNRSELALQETLSFEYVSSGTIEHSGESLDNDPSGARENHGDRVIADALANMLMKLLGIRPQRQEIRREPTVLDLAGRRAMWEAKQREQEQWT